MTLPTAAPIMPGGPMPDGMGTMGAQQGIITVLQQLVQALYTVNATILATFPNWVDVPATAASAGTPGQVAYESGWLYICVASNTWERVAIATF